MTGQLIFSPLSRANARLRLGSASSRGGGLDPGSEHRCAGFVGGADVIAAAAVSPVQPIIQLRWKAAADTWKSRMGRAFLLGID